MRLNNVALILAGLAIISNTPSTAQEGSKQPTTTVAVKRLNWRNLAGTFKNERGAVIKVFVENGSLSAKHIKLVGTMAEYQVRPNSTLFTDMSPVNGNQLILSTEDCWTYCAKSDCPDMAPYKNCSMTLTVAPDFNSFKSSARSPQYYSSRCYWALKQPWKTENSKWRRID